jgi:hypothetical protein
MREVSHIDTAPSSRKPVLTHIEAWDSSKVEAALRQELARGGQVRLFHPFLPPFLPPSLPPSLIHMEAWDSSKVEAALR